MANSNGLPENRKGVLIQFLQYYKGFLFKVSVIFILAFLPLFFTSFIFNETIIQININSEQFIDESIKLVLIYLMPMGVSIFIVLLVLFGVMHILKQLIYKEGVMFWYDFFTPIKKNIKYIFQHSLIVLLMWTLFSIVTQLSLELFDGLDIIIFVKGLEFILYFVYVILLTTVFLLKVIYDGQIQIMRTGFKIIALEFPKFIVVFVIPFMVMILAMQLNILIGMWILAGLSLGVFGLLMLIKIIFLMTLFDEYINQYTHKHLYQKGLRIVKKTKK